jgi:hypothetical protein
MNPLSNLKLEFLPPLPISANVKRVIVLVYICGQDEKLLKRSLKSLYNQEQACADLASNQCNEDLQDLEFVYLAVINGFFTASASTINYLLRIYGIESTFYSDEEDKTTNVKLVSLVSTSGCLQKVRIAKKKKLFLSLLVTEEPLDNFYLFEWFFKEFSDRYIGEYAFITSCKVAYTDVCLYNLIDYLQRKKHIACVFGLQRTMSPYMQRISSKNLKEMWYRSIQIFGNEDYAMTTLACFSEIGIFPYLVSSCVLYRLEDVTDECLRLYNRFVNNDKTRMNTLRSNIILSDLWALSVVLALKMGKFTKWVPSSIYFVEAEKTTISFFVEKALVANNTINCCVNLLRRETQTIFGSSKNLLIKLCFYMLLLLEVVLAFIKLLIPGLYMASLYFLGQSYSNYIVSIYVVLYAACYLGHFLPANYFRFFVIAIICNTMVTGFLITLNIAIVSSGILVFAVGFSVLVTIFLALLNSFESFVSLVFNLFSQLFYILTTFLWLNVLTFIIKWTNNAYKQKPSFRFSNFIKCCLILVMNYALFFVIIYFEEMEPLVFTFCFFLCVRFVQQVISLKFFLLNTDQIMTSSIETIKKPLLKLVCSLFFVLTIFSMYYGLLTSPWLTNRLRIYLPLTENELPVNSTLISAKNGMVEQVEDYISKEVSTLNTIHSTNLSKIETFQTSIITAINKNDINADCFLGPTAEPLPILESYLNFTQWNQKITNYTVFRNNFLYHNINSVNLMNKSSTTFNIIVGTFNDGMFSFKEEASKSLIEEMQQNIDVTNKSILITQNITKYITNVSGYVYVGDLKMAYGILYLSFEWLTTKPYENRTVIWGPSIFYHVPNKIWALSLLCFLIGTMVFTISSFSLFYSFICKNKSRVYNITALYSWIGMVLLFLGTLLFPFSWIKLKTFHLGWWMNLNTESYPMCGETTGIWKTGECYIGSSFILIIITNLLAILSFSTVRFTLEKSYFMTCKKAL